MFLFWTHQCYSATVENIVTPKSKNQSIYIFIYIYKYIDRVNFESLNSEKMNCSTVAL